MDSTDQHHHHHPNPNASSPESLTPLEQEVLDEYARLVGNLNNVCFLLTFLLSFLSPPPHTLLLSHRLTQHFLTFFPSLLDIDV